MQPISQIAENLEIDTKHVIPYGHYKAKIELEAIRNDKATGKLIVVTGMTPTQAGEGKTTTSVGLTQGLGKINKRVVATLREPSLGPIFGIKGGGTGGGMSRVLPEDEVNIHFTGDAHAVGSAHNLLSALTDNCAQRQQIPQFSPRGVTWRRVTDVEERSLRTIVTGIGGSANAPIRETGFDIVTASEVMAVLALSSGLTDLRSRLSKIIVGFTSDNRPVTADDVNAVGSMMSLLRYALQPNLVQTTEGQPVLVHTGPFGNIAHGCSSVLADRLGLGYSEYVVTEAGFGADLGFEKFMHIKARMNDLAPAAVVLVATVRALKSHGGVRMKDLDTPNEKAVQKGMPNIEHLISVIKSFGLPVVVSINQFPSDTPRELAIVQSGAEDAGAQAAVLSRGFTHGGNGMIDLAEAVVSATKGHQPEISYLYPSDYTAEEKVLSLAQKVYGASDVEWSTAAKDRLKDIYYHGWDKLPICMAKTHLSISHNPKLKARPSGYTFQISDVRTSIGAGFIYPIAGNIVTMPGLPSKPRELDIDHKGNVLKL